jgi:hypothetical protein
VELDPVELEPAEPVPLEAASRFADAVALAVPCASERDAVDAAVLVGVARAGSFPVAIRT